MKKNILSPKVIGLVALIIVVLGGGGYYIFNNFGKTIQEDPIEGSETQLVEENIDVKEKSEKILLEQEIGKKVGFLNKVLLTNYLKITDFKRKDKLANYEKPGVEFFQFVVDYNFAPEAMADYDIKIDKGSLDYEDYMKKTDLYKKQVQERMKKFYKVYNYDRLKQMGIIGYIKKVGDNNFVLSQLGEYLYESYYDSSLKPKTLGKLEVIRDYLNYEPIFFNKEPKEVAEVLEDLKKELDNEDFNNLYPILKKIYFYDVKASSK